MGSEGDQLPTGNEEIVTEFKWEKWEMKEIVKEFKRKKWEVKEISYLREMRRL